MDPILEIASDYNILVVEDAAHALGSEYKGGKVGTLGDITVFSFGPIKMITTGMGGMITTNNGDIDNKIRVLRSYGMDKSAYEREISRSSQPWRYLIKMLGHNFRMTDIAAAIGLIQLSKLEHFIEKRRNFAEILTKELKIINEIEPPIEPREFKHVYLYYVIKVKNGLRDKLAKYMLKKGIGVSVHWDPPLHLHNLMRKYGYKEGDFPITEKLSKEVLTLPMGPHLTFEDLEYIVNSIKEVFE
jgi:dTDP-4-amino-4,6-dideoxygalactose transaminase